MDRRTAGGLRGLINEAYVISVQDDGEVQTMSVLTHDRILRTGVPVAQPYGVGGMPPPGGTVVVLALGGDQGNLIALPAMHASYRMGGFAGGESALYDELGNRVAVRRGGRVEIVTGTDVLIDAPGCRIIAPQGVDIEGPLRVDGPITSTEDISDATGSMKRMRDQYNDHTNPANGSSTPSVRMD